MTEVICVSVTLTLTSWKTSNRGTFFWGKVFFFKTVMVFHVWKHLQLKEFFFPKHSFFTSVDLTFYFIMSIKLIFFSHCASRTIFLLSYSLPTSIPAWSLSCGLFRPLHLIGRERSLVFSYHGVLHHRELKKWTVS